MKTRVTEEWVRELLTGALSGFIATAPMTFVMDVQYRFLPFHQKQNLPPKKIAMRMASKLGIRLPFLRKKQRTLATLLSHFGYGAAAGAAYPILARNILASDIYKGSAYGLMVWVGSYLGWLPAAGIWRPKEEAAPRHALMITSHLVWGALLGLISREIRKRAVL